jgi:chromodomain-helicase-DNA-binding protein 7
MRDYQIRGLNWMISLYQDGINGILADEMGLGKTIMTLSLFDHLNKVYKLRGPFLILAPLTTLEHWKRIADEWTNMNSVLYYDPNSAEGRENIR